MKKCLFLMFVLTLSAPQLFAKQPAAQPGKMSELANLLSKIGDGCSSKASKFSSADSGQEAVMNIDAFSRNQQVGIDTQIYAASHGSRETSDYQLTLIQKKADADTAAQNENIERIQDESKQMDACLKSAEVDGKSAYSSFKDDRKNKSLIEAATTLMTAWLVNLKTISIQHPNGSDETRPTWQSAKERAGLESL